MYALQVKNLNFRYKQELILDNVNFSVPKASIYGLVGKPKSGKSTILKLILGLLRIPPATIFINGQDYSSQRDQIQMLTGNIVDLPYYQGFLTVWENLKYWDIQFQFGESRISEVLKLIGLTGNKSKKVKSLTLLQQRKLSIGISLYHDPDILIFDDLYKDLDEKSKKDLSKLLVKIQKTGKTIIYSTREIKDATTICTEIGLINNGCLLHNGTELASVSSVN
jgi:ABC-type multidrug transport system ATPase subunit